MDLVKATLATNRLPGLLEQASRAVINGVWLGLLDDARLRRLDETYYDGEPEYRTREWNERGLFPWEEELVATHFEGCTRVVVTSCGGGREVLALSRAGFDAVGFEPHPALASYAAQLLADHGVVDAAHPVGRDAFPADRGPWDGAVVGWGAYSLMHTRARRVAFLAQARPHLVPGAPVLLSFFDRAADGRELRWTAAIANGLRRVRGDERPLELGDTLAPNLVHVFTKDELAGEVDAAGFDLRSYGVTGRAENGVRYAAAVIERR